MQERIGRKVFGDLDAGLQEFTDSLQFRIIDCPRSFSHVRQCKLGVRQAFSETVVFLSNDESFLGADALFDLISCADTPCFGY